MSVGIEPVDLAELQLALRPLRGEFTDIRVFGSRATGRFRRSSDIDLVVYGASPATLSAIAERLDDSLLPMTADVVGYETITSDILREHIDRVALPLPRDPRLDEGNKVAAR